MGLTGALLGVLLVTGYTCPPYCGNTASGQPVGAGVAACPPQFAYGVRLMVEDVGVVTCLDSYAAGLSDRVDVWVPSLAEAYALTGPHRVWLEQGP